MEYKIFHDTPVKEKGLVMLPVGVSFNRDIQKMKEGDEIVFLNGEKHKVLRTSYFGLKWQATDFLCRYIYGKGIDIVFRKWLTNAVIRGYSKKAISDNKCLLVWYE